jgi:phage terminase large subunit
MSRIDLSDLFPSPAPGAKPGALPKQQAFMDAVLDAQGPKFVGYYGGYGSGKSLILCIVNIIQGVLYGGEYVIARQFNPELKRTTAKLFLELLPKELLLEHRIADQEVHIKSQNGKAIFYFVGLDSPEKLDSLNLSGASIDEASQVGEDAFLKLQGRLRHPKGLRKLLIVGNPKGHDWAFRYFIKKDMLADQKAKNNYKMIVAPSTENKHLPEGYIESMLASYSKERIARDIMGSFDSFEGQVYSEFNRSIHVIKPFAIPPEWTRVVGIDAGFVNPSAWVWGAVDYDSNVYIFREYYQTQKLIKDVCREALEASTPEEIKSLQGAFIDPSVKAVRSQTGASDWDNYLEYLPKDFPLIPARNDVAAGIDKVKSFLRINDTTKKPRLFIFDTCSNLLDEISQYRYEELTPNQQGLKNEKESPRKYKDHTLDALRYLIMSRPDSPQYANKRKDALEASTLEGSVLRELEAFKRPKPKDPFGDY